MLSLFKMCIAKYDQYLFEAFITCNCKTHNELRQCMKKWLQFIAWRTKTLHLQEHLTDKELLQTGSSRTETLPIKCTKDHLWSNACTTNDSCQQTALLVVIAQ